MVAYAFIGFIGKSEAVHQSQAYVGRIFLYPCACPGVSSVTLTTMRLSSLSPCGACLSFVVLMACVVSCAPPRQVSSKDFVELRDYILPTTIADPQAQWNPASYQIVARAPKGMALLDEGTGKQEFYAAQDSKESCHPWWINQKQFIFGPSVLMVPVADGSMVPSTQGLTVVTIGGVTNALTNRGYRPRIWNDIVIAQDENRVIQVNDKGEIRDFAPGFFAEPQRTGPGICWLDKPVTEADYWSGDTKRRGSLIIRWSKKKTTEIPNAIEPRWTHDGGVVATVLRAEPIAGQPWWSGGTDVVYCAGPEVAPVVIATNARTAAPHPILPVIAAVDSMNGALLLCDLSGNVRLRKADFGDHPQWSHDGVRLMAEEPSENKPTFRSLHVYVYKVEQRP